MSLLDVSNIKKAAEGRRENSKVSLDEAKEKMAAMHTEIQRNSQKLYNKIEAIQKLIQEINKQDINLMNNGDWEASKILYEVVNEFGEELGSHDWLFKESNIFGRDGYALTFRGTIGIFDDGDIILEITEKDWCFIVHTAPIKSNGTKLSVDNNYNIWRIFWGSEGIRPYSDAYRAGKFTELFKDGQTDFEWIFDEILQELPHRINNYIE